MLPMVGSCLKLAVAPVDLKITSMAQKNDQSEYFTAVESDFIWLQAFVSTKRGRTWWPRFKQVKSAVAPAWLGRKAEKSEQYLWH